MTLNLVTRGTSAHIDFPEFKPGAPWWGGHLQTLAGALPTVSPRDLDQYPGERLFALVPDSTGDRLVATLHRPASPDTNRCLIILVHGVSGSEDSSYVLRSAIYFLNLGYPVLRANLRGAGPSRPPDRGEKIQQWQPLRAPKRRARREISSTHSRRESSPSWQLHCAVNRPAPWKADGRDRRSCRHYIGACRAAATDRRPAGWRAAPDNRDSGSKSPTAEHSCCPRCRSRQIGRAHV